MTSEEKESLLWLTFSLMAIFTLIAWPVRAERRYSDLFHTYGRGVPVEYLTALAQRESDLNHLDKSNGCWGLLQVCPAVFEDYNERFGTSYSKEDMLKPAVNIAVACELLARIANTFGTKHRKAFPNGVDWGDTRFAEIVTFAWNAGYSESRGVGRVLTELEAKGVQPQDVTIDRVYDEAHRMGDIVSEYLRRADKVSWCKSVVRLYAVYLRGAGV